MHSKWLAALLLLACLSAQSLAADDALATAALGATAAGDGAAVVGAAIDTNTNPTDEAAKSTETAKSGEELAEAVEANSEAQDYNEKTKPVKAQIVKQEPAAMIASGTGDLDTTGTHLTHRHTMALSHAYFKDLPIELDRRCPWHHGQITDAKRHSMRLPHAQSGSFTHRSIDHSDYKC